MELNMRFSKVSFAVALAALAVVGFKFEEGGLKLSPKVGDVHKYKMSGDMMVMGTEAKVTATVTDKVAKVEDNGNISTVSTTSDMQIDLGGGAPISQPVQTVTNVQRSDGTYVEIKGETIGASEYRLAAITTLKLPDFALAKDKTWTWDCPADTKTGVVHTKGDYKVLGDEKVHDVDAWKISTKVAEVDGDTPASTESTVWISKADGTMVKFDSKGTNLPISNVPVPVSGTMSQELAP